MSPAIQAERPSVDHQRAGARPRRGRHSAVWLLASLVGLIVSSPFVQEWNYGNGLEVVLVSLVMGFGVAAAGADRRTLTIAVALAIPALGVRWLEHMQPTLVPPWLTAATGMLFLAFAVLQILKYVLHVPRVDTNVLCAGLAGYLMIGLLWIPAYVTAGQLDPAAFSMTASAATGARMDGFNAFYFSFITLCTVGYGDVVPVSKLARMLAVTEAVAGLFYVAVLISRLVAIYSSSTPGPEEGPRVTP